MKIPRFYFSALFLLAATSLAPSTLAQNSPSPPLDEANRRWNLAFKLAEQKNYAASVAEFQAVYQLRPTSQVLYYMGRTLAAKGSPLEAVEALEKALGDSAFLTKEELKDTHLILQEQRKRVGSLMISANVAGALIEIDGMELGEKTPLTKAIPVASGDHVVEVDATALGYRPMRRKISVAGLSRSDVAFELIPGGFARVAIDVELAGVEVLVGAELVAKTPLRDPLKLAAGVHTIELRRAGYQSVKRELKLDVGDSSRIEADLKEDGAWIAVHGGRLELELSEKPADIWVDGKARGTYREGLKLAPGVHRIRVERSGFWGVEREVDVKGGKTERVAIRFEPNAETLEKYLEGIRSRRNWGIGLIAAGVGVGVAGGLVFGHFKDESATSCVYRNSLPGCDIQKGIMYLGAVGIGLGVVLVGTGAWRLEWNNDPGRYDVKASSQPLARLPLLPILGPTREGLGLTMGVMGKF